MPLSAVPFIERRCCASRAAAQRRAAARRHPLLRLGRRAARLHRAAQRLHAPRALHGAAAAVAKPLPPGGTSGATSPPTSCARSAPSPAPLPPIDAMLIGADADNTSGRSLAHVADPALLTAPRQLLLLGGGHAHVQVLEALAREPLAGAQVTLVTPFARQIYSGMVPGWWPATTRPRTARSRWRRWRRPRASPAASARRRAGCGRAPGHAGRRPVLDYDLLSLDTGPGETATASPARASTRCSCGRSSTSCSGSMALRGAACDWRWSAAAPPASSWRWRWRPPRGPAARACRWSPARRRWPARVRRCGGALARAGGAGRHGAPAPPSAMAADHVVLADGTRLGCDRRCWRSAPRRRAGWQAAAWRWTSAASSPPGPRCRARRTPRSLPPATWPRATMRRTRRAASTRCAPGRRWPPTCAAG